MKTFSTQLVRRAFTVAATALVISTLSGACQKKEENTFHSGEVVRSAQVIDEMLVFENKTSFDDLMVALAKNQSELSAWERRQVGFKSMRTAYDELSSLVLEKVAKTGSTSGYEDIISIRTYGDEQEIVRNIYDPILASIVNRKGLVQIGEIVYKVSLDKLYSVPQKNKSLLLNLRIEDKSLHAGVRVERIVNSTTEDRSTFTPANARVLSRVDNCENRYRSDRRVKGEIWISEIGPLYSGAGVRSKHQNRFLRIWWSDSAPWLRLSVTGIFTQYFNGLPVATENVSYDSGQRSDENLIEYTFEQCFNTGCNFTITGSFNTHSALSDDYTFVSCSTNY